MIRAHLLAEVTPRSVDKPCQPKTNHLPRYREVCAILRKRLHDATRNLGRESDQSSEEYD